MSTAPLENLSLWQVLIPIITFALGLITPRLTMTKKDRLDHKQTLYENAKELIEGQKLAFSEFTSALKAYHDSTDPTLDDFYRIATSGDNYFRFMKMIAEAVMADMIQPYMQKETIIPMLKEAIEKTLPAYYAALRQIANKKGISYKGELKRENYQSIYAAVEKFDQR